MATQFINRYGRWAFAAALIAVLGLVFTAVKLPAGWLIAGMVGAAVTAILFRRQLNPPAKAMAAAQGVIGVVAVEPLTKLSGSDLVHFAGCAAFSVTITLGLSVVFGIMLARFAPDLGVATANLSLIAGGASTISSMARELGADERYVALSQYLRLTIVVLTMPIVLSHLGTADAAPGLVGAHDVWHWPGLLALAALVFAGGHLAKLVRMPAPYLLGPLVVAMVLALVDPSLDLLMNPTTVVTNIAYVVIGWQAGGGFALDVLRRFVKLIPLTLMFIALTIASCFAVALAVSSWGGCFAGRRLPRDDSRWHLRCARDRQRGPLRPHRGHPAGSAAGDDGVGGGHDSEDHRLAEQAPSRHRRGIGGFSAATNSCSGLPVVPYRSWILTSPELASVDRYRCAVARDTPISADTSADDIGWPDARSACSTRSFVGDATAVGDWTGASFGRRASSAASTSLPPRLVPDRILR